MVPFTIYLYFTLVSWQSQASCPDLKKSKSIPVPLQDHQLMTRETTVQKRKVIDGNPQLSLVTGYLRHLSTSIDYRTGARPVSTIDC